ncbi:hypothetical protein ACSFV5_07450 [Acinetobacter sp. HC8-3S]
MNEFQGTNPILEILGDEPTIRDISVSNNSSLKIVEPLTGVSLDDGTVIRVHGDIALQEIQNNIDQLNSLKGTDISFTAELVVEEPSP